MKALLVSALLALIALLLATQVYAADKPAAGPVDWLAPGFKPPRHYLDPPPDVRREQRKFDRYMQQKAHQQDKKRRPQQRRDAKK